MERRDLRKRQEVGPDPCQHEQESAEILWCRPNEQRARRIRKPAPAVFVRRTRQQRRKLVTRRDGARQQ